MQQRSAEAPATARNQRRERTGVSGGRPKRSFIVILTNNLWRVRARNTGDRCDSGHTDVHGIINTIVGVVAAKRPAVATRRSARVSSRRWSDRTANIGAMAYIDDRVVHDADAHIMETPDWLRDYADPSVRDRIERPGYVNEMRQTGDPGGDEVDRDRVGPGVRPARRATSGWRVRRRRAARRHQRQELRRDRIVPPRRPTPCARHARREQPADVQHVPQQPAAARGSTRPTSTSPTAPPKLTTEA